MGACLPLVGRDWKIGGVPFLDANPKALAGYACPHPVIADPIKKQRIVLFVRRGNLLQA